MNNIKPKESTAIINALSGGVVPNVGIQYITVGRSEEINAGLKSMEEVQNGNSVVKFWVGDYGSGKSFMLHLLKTIALKQNMVVAMADFSPERRLYDNDRRAVAIYSKLIESLSIQTKQDGDALQIILEKWIEQVMADTAQELNVPITEIRDQKYKTPIQNNIVKTINKITEVGGYEFGLVVTKYFEGYLEDNSTLTKCALRWLRGEYTTKTDAKNDLGVREIIADQNYYDMLKNLAKFFVHIGYAGLMINLDEAINLYKIVQSNVREKNYEKILMIYNDCLQGKTSNLFINFGGTKDFLENERRGLFSYPALKSRLEGNQYETTFARDFAQPVIYLYPLSHEEIFVLLQKLKEIFDFNFGVNINILDEDIKLYMEGVFNKPGTDKYLTPREVIKGFLDILSIMRQNPSLDKKEIIKSTEVKPAEPSGDIDSIEVI